MTLFFFSSIAIGAENHITVVHEESTALTGAMNVAIAISCPQATPSKFDYLAPQLTDYTSENAAFLAAASARSDIHIVVDIRNATPGETLAWLQAFVEKFDEPIRQTIITVSCPAWGGDTDEELLLMNGGTLLFVDLLTVMKPLAMSSIWLLDASRNISTALDDNVSSFGPTADDVVKYGIVPDALAISSSAPGKYGESGLIGAAARVLTQSRGGPINLQSFYHLGIKPAVPTLELFTSMGIIRPEAWDGNLSRPILLGGPLIVPVAYVNPSETTKTNIPNGCWLAGGGVLSTVVGATFAANASVHYDTLSDFNEFGGETQTELDETVNAYHTDLALGITFGSLGLAAIGIGTGWAITDQGANVTLIPTANGITVAGSW